MKLHNQKTEPERLISGRYLKDNNKAVLSARQGEGVNMKAGLLGAVLGTIIGLAISSLTICKGTYAKCENEAIKPIIIWVEHKEPQV